MTKVYRVDVTFTVFVTAESEEAAERYCLNGGWEEDPSSVYALTFTEDDVTEDDLGSTPWAASGLTDEELHMTVGQWLQRQKKDGTR